MSALDLLRFRVGFLLVALKDSARHTTRSLRIAATAMPVRGGSPDGDGEGQGDGDGEGDGGSGDAGGGGSDGEGDASGSGDGDGEGEGDGTPPPPAAGTRADPDWKKMARKHEREAKKARQEREDLAKKLKEREDADKSEQEKAIETAREEAKQEAESSFAEQRREDRIESAVTALAVKGFKVTVKDGEEEKEKTLRFADPDDAQLRLERAIRKGDLSYDDIYSDGTVKSDAVTEFLRELLEENAHLQASDGSGKPARVAGSADGGKGKAAPEGPGSDPAKHFEAIRKRSKAA